jgi:hypothetical protein
MLMLTSSLAVFTAFRVSKIGVCDEIPHIYFSSTSNGTLYYDHTKLYGPELYGGNDCPPFCGCVETPVDCPQWYNVSLVQESCLHARSTDNDALWELRDKRKNECRPGGTTSTGGWCLSASSSGEVVHTNSHSIVMPINHGPMPKKMLDTLSEFIVKENVNSINDFGAGVGQYKAGISQRFRNLSYYAYDGAGNIENYTYGYVRFFDLTIPLSLPVTDWVLSLAVGEHIPSRYEGMVIRNLHYHNTKGIILMWASLGYHGHKHINNHSQQYIIKIFESLGYSVDSIWTKKFRRRKQNYDWFIKDTIVFRRERHFL